MARFQPRDEGPEEGPGRDEVTDVMCESCGSNITGESAGDMPHMCSIRTAKGWRKEIPLHRLGRPLMKGEWRWPELCREDHELQQRWIEQHHDCDRLVVDTRSGHVIEAVYLSPVANHLAEQMDTLANVSRLNLFAPDQEPLMPRPR